MKYFDIQVTVVAQGRTLEEAQLNAYKFMPHIKDGEWNPNGKRQVIDSWFVNDVDNDILDMKARGLV
jgi:hypothetical protein